MTNTSSATMIVPKLLEMGNYKGWSIFMEDYLISQELWDGIIVPFVFNADHPLLSESEWRKRNASALTAIKISCGPESFVPIKYTRLAREALDMLAEMHKTEPETDECIPKMNVAMASTIVPELLERDNYERWSICMKNYLVSQDLWDAVLHGWVPDSGVSKKEWIKKNATALHAIQISCGAKKFDAIKQITSAKIAWNTLEKESAPTLHDDDTDLPIDLSSLPVSHSWFYGFQTMKRTDSLIVQNAIHKGDVDAVMDFIKRHPEAKELGYWTGDTSLHYATMVGQTNIVKALVESMSALQVQKKDKCLGTALTYAAAFGNTEIAKYLVSKDFTLLSIEDIPFQETPVVTACRIGHKELTNFLYSETPFQILIPENGKQGSKLLLQCFNAQRFDIMFNALHRCQSLIDENWKDLLEGFARTPAAFITGSRLKFWQRWIYERLKVDKPNYFCVVTINQEEKNFEKRPLPGQPWRLASILLPFLGIKQIHALMLSHVFAGASLHLICERLSKLQMRKNNFSALSKALTRAIENGICEFLIEMAETNADSLIAPSMEETIGGNLLMHTVAFRQEKIARLIIGLPFGKSFISLLDTQGNNVLHIAGQLASDLQLSHISGAALQMHREMKWFKEVESLVTQYHKDAKNENGETAFQVFNREHKDLLKQAEDWMKGLVNSYITVDGITITILLAGAFTLPGGGQQNANSPINKNKTAYTIYIISNATSLFAAAISVVIFLGFLTSRYNMQDFHKPIPKRLMAGLSISFISIAAMMIAFCSALSLILENRWWIIIPSVLLAGIPVSLFLWLQFPLLVEIYVLTYRSPIFSKKKSLAHKIKAFFFGKKKIE